MSNALRRTVKYHKENPNIQVGSIVTAYTKGYHRVTEVFLMGTNELVEYQRVATTTGRRLSSKPTTCHIGYCALLNIDAIFDEEIATAIHKRDTLRGILDGFTT